MTVLFAAYTNGIRWMSMLWSQDAHLFQFSSEKQALICLCSKGHYSQLGSAVCKFYARVLLLLLFVCLF